jgi:hypothetical protein
MRGLYLLDANLIAEGTKTAIATARPVDLSGYHVLVVKDGDTTHAVGVVSIGLPESTGTKDFDAQQAKHKVTSQNRMQWWPGVKKLYLHRVLRFIPFSKPIPATVAPGTNMTVKQVDIGTPRPLTILSMLQEADGAFVYEYEEA